MLIGGLQKFTALDFPDKIAATVFTVGCNFRCPYCHNGEIVSWGEADAPGLMAQTEVLEFLATRRGDLDGVCITGGEPTLQKDLVEFVQQVKALGFAVKIDTNGSNFEVVQELLASGLVDYFAIDIKTAFDKYHRLQAPAAAAERTLESVALIVEKGVLLELRTTVVPGVVEPADFDRIIERINGRHRGILPALYRYGVQAFRPQKCLDKNYEELVPYADEVLEEIAEKLREYCPRVDILK